MQDPPKTPAPPPVKPIVIGKACVGDAIWLNSTDVQTVTAGRSDSTEVQVTINFVFDPNLRSQKASIEYSHDWESEKAAEAALASCEKDLRASQ